MKIKFVLLMLVMVCSCVAYGAVDNPEFSQGSATATMIINQKHPNSPQYVASESNQGEYISKTDCDRMFSDYIDHVAWVVGLIGLVVGVFAPLTINMVYRKEMRDMVKEHDKKINAYLMQIDKYDAIVKGFEESIAKTNVDIENIKQISADAKKEQLNIFNNSKKYFEEQQKELKSLSDELNTKTAQVFGALAFTDDNVDRKLIYINKALEIVPQSEYLLYMRAIIMKGKAMKKQKEGDSVFVSLFTKAIDDVNIALSLNPRNELKEKLVALKEQCKKSMDEGMNSAKKDE